MDKSQKVGVKNRSNSTAVYSVPDLRVSRQFSPGETKQITVEELEALTYYPGGLTLIKDCLLIEDAGIAKQILNQKIEPEYWLDEAGVKKLMIEGSLDEFLDCLDFAPEGVIELIKVIATKMPLNDVAKREAIKNKTGYDLDRALLNLRLVKEEEAAEGKVEETTPERRVKKTDTGRRATPNYKIVTPKGE
jgi:hypothetical protein